MPLFRYFVIALCVLSLAGCSWFKDDEDDTPPDQGERALYNTAQRNNS